MLKFTYCLSSRKWILREQKRRKVKAILTRIDVVPTTGQLIGYNFRFRLYSLEQRATSTRLRLLPQALNQLHRMQDVAMLHIITDDDAANRKMIQ